MKEDCNIYFECPYGHTAKFEFFEVGKPRYGESSTLHKLVGLKCLQCGRRFALEQHFYRRSYNLRAPMNGEIRSWFYEVDGSWVAGDELLAFVEFECAQDRPFTDEEMRDYNQRKANLLRDIARLTEDLAVAQAEDNNATVAIINAELDQVNLQLERLRPVESS